jgi:hypothetical protein
MAKIRKNHTTEFKAKVAIEAIRQQKTLNELTAEYGIHATQINLWKKQALAVIPGAFSKRRGQALHLTLFTFFSVCFSARLTVAYHAKIFTYLGKCIVSTPIRLGHTFVAGFISC